MKVTGLLGTSAPRGRAATNAATHPSHQRCKLIAVSVSFSGFAPRICRITRSPIAQLRHGARVTEECDSADAKPRLPRGVRLTHSERRWLGLLAPEVCSRLTPSRTSLKRAPARTFQRSRYLAALQSAARTHLCDVTALCAGLADKKLLDLTGIGLAWRNGAAAIISRWPFGRVYAPCPLAVRTAQSAWLDRRGTNSTPPPGRGCSARLRRWGAAMPSLGASPRRAAIWEIVASARERVSIQSDHIGRRRRDAHHSICGGGPRHVRFRSGQRRSVFRSHRGYRGPFARKCALAAEVKRLGLLLTVNLVIHRATSSVSARWSICAELASDPSVEIATCNITAGR